MAASVCAHLLARGWSVRLDTLDGRCLVAQAEGGTGHARVLEALATVTTATSREALRTGSDLSVVILPAAAIGVVPAVHHRSLAFVVDVTAWGERGPDAREALDRLRAQGWHAAAITPAQGSLPAAWQSAIDDATLAATR
jgi:cell division septation protein DedD